MSAYKGFPAVLESAKLVWAEHPDVHFVFIGPPTEESACLFTQQGDARLHTLGRVDDAAKVSALAACDVFCMPSRSEILPTVYLEAWALGKPVVAGKIPNLQALVDDGVDGLLVEQTPEAVARALRQLLRDPAARQRLGWVGQAKVAERYAPEVVACQTESLYQQVLEERRRA
jgi:glycosyltransferase involved in cell wall biosynthesis